MPDRRSPGRRRRSRAALLVMLTSGAVASCAGPSPSLADLAAEPVLRPLQGEVVLLQGRVAPRRGRIGVAPRDGAVERVVALSEGPDAIADELQRQFDSRYGFQRTELGTGSPNTVELRGRVVNGPVVIATASTLRPTPLFVPLGSLRAPPPDQPTSLVVTVISRQ